MSKKEEGSFVVTYKEGGTRWKADWTDEEYTENGETRVKTVLKGQGLRYPYANDTKWESVSVWKTGSSFTPVESSTEVRCECDPVHARGIGYFADDFPGFRIGNNDLRRVRHIQPVGRRIDDQVVPLRRHSLSDVA